MPLFVTAGWFRLAADKYYVPISLAVPGLGGAAVRQDKVTLDVRASSATSAAFPVGAIHDTLTVPPASADEPRVQAGAVSDRA